jgi:competence protein ComEC
LIEVEAARLGGASRSTSNPAVAIDGKVMIHAPPYPAYRYGQRVIVQGEVERPSAAEYPGWFDYRAFLARQAIFAIMDETEELHITAHPTQAGNPALRLLYQFRAHCQEILLRELPEPQASLAVGILLGGKAAIPDEVYDDFSAAGIAHILVISGWHLTLVATMLQQLLRTISGRMPVGRLQIGRWTTFWIVILVLWGYAFFVGGGIAALRAAVMASLAALATATERQAHTWIGLSVACWALTMLNPHVLWQIGFQLSVAATASIFAFNTPITAWLQGKIGHMVEGVAGAVDILATTLAVHVLLLPVILYHFGNLAVIAPLANLAIVPVVPYAMILGALALGVGLLWLPLGQGVAALLAWLPLAWMSEGAHFFASLPWATVRLPSLSLWWIGGYYALVGGWRIHRLREERYDYRR